MRLLDFDLLLALERCPRWCCYFGFLNLIDLHSYPSQIGIAPSWRLCLATMSTMLLLVHANSSSSTCTKPDNSGRSKTYRCHCRPCLEANKQDVQNWDNKAHLKVLLRWAWSHWSCKPSNWWFSQHSEPSSQDDSQTFAPSPAKENACSSGCRRTKWNSHSATRPTTWWMTRKYRPTPHRRS